MPFALHSERLNLRGQEKIKRPILFFDGDCVLCNRTVQWLIRHERHDTLQFAALNSETAQAPSGTDYLGGGGGGGLQGHGSIGGDGGNGVVILKIPTAAYSGTTTGSPTVTTSGDFKIVKYESSGTYTA